MSDFLREKHRQRRKQLNVPDELLAAIWIFTIVGMFAAIMLIRGIIWWTNLPSVEPTPYTRQRHPLNQFDSSETYSRQEKERIYKLQSSRDPMDRWAEEQRRQGRMSAEEFEQYWYRSRR